MFFFFFLRKSTCHVDQRKSIVPYAFLPTTVVGSGYVLKVKHVLEKDGLQIADHIGFTLVSKECESKATVSTGVPKLDC